MASKSKTTTTATVSINPAVRAALEASCKSFSKVADKQAALNEERTGTYTGMMQAAALAGDVASFRAAYESLKADVSGNVGGIGKRLGCTLGKPDSDGKASYTVPGGMRSAASVIIGAMEAGISLHVPGDDGKPSKVLRSFTDIRKAKAQADAEASKSKESPLEAAQRNVRELAAKIAAGASALTLVQAAEAAKILAAVFKLETGEPADKTKAAA